MLTDTKIKNLKAKDKLYKVSDREGLYVAVLVSGSISFRYDYRLHGRRETLTIGRYGADGITLAEARTRLYAAKKLVEAGISPAAEKRDNINNLKEALTFHDYYVRWLAESNFSDSTRHMRKLLVERDIKPTFGNRLLHEITPRALRTHCEKIRDRGAASMAVQVRQVVGSIFRYAINHGANVENPAEKLVRSSIATFKPRERALTPKEIGIFFRTLDGMGTMPTIKAALKMALLTMVRKSELSNAVWDEFDLSANRWVIPAARMKAGRQHVVYLSTQVKALLEGLKLFSGNSPYVFPGRYDQQSPIVSSSLNRMVSMTIEKIRGDGFDIEHFTVHDLRRTASTLLHEAGFNTDWIEKSLAHEQRGVRAVYNKAEYAEQRRDMLQKWADMVDGWINVGMNNGQ